MGIGVSETTLGEGNDLAQFLDRAHRVASNCTSKRLFSGPSFVRRRKTDLADFFRATGSHRWPAPVSRRYRRSQSWRSRRVRSCIANLCRETIIPSIENALGAEAPGASCGARGHPRQ